MEENLITPLKVSFVNKSKAKESFIPYKDFNAFSISALGKVSFTVDNSEIGMYYKEQTSEDLVVSVGSNTDSVLVGEYDSTTTAFTSGAGYNVALVNETSEVAEGIKTSTFEYKVYGKLPYGAADQTLGLAAGNRFKVRTHKTGVAYADLPSGNIAEIKVEPGTTQSYKKAAFADDGALVTVINTNKSARLTITINWSSTEISVYKYDFTFVELASENESVELVEDLEITLPCIVKLENIGQKSINFVAYKEEQVITIDNQDSFEFNVESANEVFYYLLQATDTLKVSIR